MQSPERTNEAKAAPKRRRTGREEARPIHRILDRKTGRVVGWLYEWNTGERMVMWKAGKREDVVYD